MKGKTYLLIGVILVVVAAIVYLESIKPKIPDGSLSGISNVIGNDLSGSKYPKAPELTDISGYINTNSNLTIASLKGKVVIVDFWTYSCINCLRTLPYLNAWYDKYKDDGLVIIGIHTPEFNFEKDYNNVEMAVQKYDIKYPVVLDNDYGTWTAYQNQYWPRKYIIDKQGHIRFDHIGEGEYPEEEQEIQMLLSENGTLVNESLSNIADQTPTTDNSPETYLGWQFALPRGENIGGDGFKPNETYTYPAQDPNKLQKDIAYVENTWYNKEDSLVSFNDSIMYYKFTAKNANIVLDGKGIIQVYLDNSPIPKDAAGADINYYTDGSAYINVTEPRLYDIYSGNYSTHVLKLVFTEGIQANAWTFG